MKDTLKSLGHQNLAVGGVKDLCLVSGLAFSPFTTPSPPHNPSWNSCQSFNAFMLHDHLMVHLLFPCGAHGITRSVSALGGGKVMGSRLGPNRIIAKDVKSCT